MKIFDLIGPWNRKLYYVYKLLAEGKLGTVTQSFTEINVKTGQQFFTRHQFLDIPVGESRYMLYRTGADPSIFKQRVVKTNSDNVYYRFYYDPVITADGTPIEIKNPNEVTPQSSAITQFHSTTFSDMGTLAAQDWIPGAAGVGNTSSGQYDTEGFERISAANRDYLIEVENAGSGPVSVEIFYTWYEGPITPLGPNQDLL